MSKKPKKRRRQKWRWMRYRKGDTAHNLLCATQRWIHANGGTAVVIGSIGVMNEDNPFIAATKGRYRICVGALGMPPIKKEKADAPAG